MLTLLYFKFHVTFKNGNVYVMSQRKSGYKAFSQEKHIISLSANSPMGEGVAVA